MVFGLYIYIIKGRYKFDEIDCKNLKMKYSLIYTLSIGILMLLSCNKSNDPDTPNNQKSNGVTTIKYDEVTRTSAKVIGLISGKNGSSILSAGICFGVDPDPTYSDSRFYPFPNLQSREEQTVMLISLKPQTRYYARACINDNSGTRYAQTVSFTTLSNGVATGIKMTETSRKPDISNYRWIVRVNVSIADDGGNPITASGICYSTTQTAPTIENSTVARAGSRHIFEWPISLNPDDTYYVRAFAYNSAGTSYSNTIVLKSPVEFGYPHKGGVIAYIFKQGDKGYKPNETHGLLVSLPLKTRSIYWGGNYCENYPVSTSTLLGEGYANTVKIVNAQTSPPGTQCSLTIFKQVLEEKFHGHGGWFIPSWEEVEKIHKTAYYLQGAVGYLGTSSMAGKDSMYVFDRNWPSSKIPVSKNRSPFVSYIGYF